MTGNPQQRKPITVDPVHKKNLNQTGSEKLKLEAAGDWASETAALVALKAYRFKGMRVFTVVVT